jgi:hypothetical protein
VGIMGHFKEIRMSNPLNVMKASPKMNEAQAKMFWEALTPQQQFQFNEMMQKMNKGELLLKEVNVDDNEQIQNIVLEPKDKKGQSDKPFYKHFDLKEDRS